MFSVVSGQRRKEGKAVAALVHCVALYIVRYTTCNNFVDSVDELRRVTKV